MKSGNDFEHSSLNAHHMWNRCYRCWLLLLGTIVCIGCSKKEHENPSPPEESVILEDELRLGLPPSTRFGDASIDEVKEKMSKQGYAITLDEDWYSRKEDLDGFDADATSAAPLPYDAKTLNVEFRKGQLFRISLLGHKGNSVCDGLREKIDSIAEHRRCGEGYRELENETVWNRCVETLTGQPALMNCKEGSIIVSTGSIY